MTDPKRYFINNNPEELIASTDKEVQEERVQCFVNSIGKKFKLESRNADGGLYVGLAGISYMFFHLSKLPSFQSWKTEFLKRAVGYLEIPLKLASQQQSSRHVTDKTGFLTGNVGVYAVSAAIYRILGMDKEAEDSLSRFKEAGQLLKPLNWFKHGGDELFVGRAGYLCAVLWLRKELQNEVVPDSEIEVLLNTMVESGKQYSKAIKSNFPLMYHYYDTQYLGAAHGLAGILFVMLSFPNWLSRYPDNKNLVKSSLDCYLRLQTPNGNFPCAMDELGGGRPAEDELIHWCHGAPGAVYLMAKAYQVFKEQKYLDSALKCGEITWQKGLLKKGPGICHGVAGSGYVFLVLYQLTQDSHFLSKAQHFMNFIYSPEFSRAKEPDSPYSLFEGIAGTACFAADLTSPSTAAFPFMSLI